MIKKFIEKYLTCCIEEKNIYKKIEFIKLLACIIVVFIYINWKYMNFLEYIKFPIFPLLPSIVRKINIIRLFIKWFIISLILDLIRNKIIEWDIKYEGKGILKKYGYICYMKNYIFSLIFLIYALNMFVDFINGILPKNFIPLYIAIFIIIFRFFNNNYYLYVNNLYKLKMEIEQNKKNIDKDRLNTAADK